MKCKKVFDARKLPRKAKEQLRIAAVRRVDAGESPEAVASGMGVNRRQIYRWIEAYHYGGEESLKAKPIPGATPKLTARQMAKLARSVREKNPLQLKFEYALWTLAIIRELIRREFAVHLSEVSVGRLMRRLGFSPQRPLYRAWQQDPKLVDEWRTQSIGFLAGLPGFFYFSFCEKYFRAVFVNKYEIIFFFKCYRKNSCQKDRSYHLIGFQKRIRVITDFFRGIFIKSFFNNTD